MRAEHARTAAALVLSLMITLQLSCGSSDAPREKAQQQNEIKLKTPEPVPLDTVTEIYVQQICMSKRGISRGEVTQRVSQLCLERSVDGAVFMQTVRTRLQDIAWGRLVANAVQKQCPGPPKKEKIE